MQGAMAQGAIAADPALLRRLARTALAAEVTGLISCCPAFATATAAQATSNRSASQDVMACCRLWPLRCFLQGA